MLPILRYYIGLVLIAISLPIYAEQFDLTKQLDSVIDKAIKQQRVVGTVVLVSENGRLIYHRAAGMADRETAKPMTENTIFRLASVSKPIITVAALRLIEEGKISLDDPVTKWLPSFKPHLADGTTPTITIRELLTHTSGLNYGFSEEETGPYHLANVSDGLDQPGLSMEENLRRLNTVPLLFKPGTGWRYSLSIDVLGAILSKATKQPLPLLIADYVTTPLQMKDTAFTLTAINRLATPYKDGTPRPTRMADHDSIPILGGNKIVFTPNRYANPNSYPSGGAGMLGTAPDFMRLLDMLNNNGKPLLRATTVTQMMTDQTHGLAEQGGLGWGFGYGGSVLINPTLTHTPQSKGTLQWGGVYGHNWFYDPVRKIAVVIFTNTALEGMYGKFPNEIRDAIYSNNILKP